MVKNMNIKMLYCRGKTIYQSVPVEKNLTRSRTPLTLISNVASFAKLRDATSTLLALKDQNIQVYQCFLLSVIFELLFLLISSQDAVLEL